VHKLLKIIGCLLLAILALLAAATLLLKVVYPPAKLRRLVEEQIRERLHRQAQIGPVELSLSGISAERLRLSNVPDFSAGTFLYVEKAKIRWALAPLLHRTLVIEKVALTEPQINLVRRADGKTLNISDLAQAAAPAPATRTRTARANVSNGSSWPWVVKNIALRKGTIRLDDRSPARQTSTLSGIDLTLSDLTATAARGELTIARVQNPVYVARDFTVNWDLRDVDPSLARVNGSIHMKQGPGVIQNLADLVATSATAKLFLMPILMLQNLDRLGLLRLGLPDFSHLPIDGITGTYRFKEGNMMIESFKIASAQLSISSQGTVQLASGALNVDVEMNAPQKTLLGEMNLKMHLSGTLSHPQTNLDSLRKKAFKATVNQLLQSPDAQKELHKVLNNLFH
jgi:hypothetical protein